jgi:uncharacterized protein YjiS (DUF1127 family)
MTTTSYNTPFELLHPARETSRSLLSRKAMSLYQTLLLASRRVAIRRARRELLELPDSMLKDMGITRGEITAVVEFGRADTTRLPRFDGLSARS